MSACVKRGAYTDSSVNNRVIQINKWNIFPFMRITCPEGGWFGVLDVIGNALWGPWSLAAYMLCGLWLTLRARGVQFTRAREWIKLTMGAQAQPEKSDASRDRPHGVISARRAACVALAGSLGVGNIAGVATALTLGGPGAALWMVLSALLSMALGYAENVLGHVYRRRGAKPIAGPMAYMKEGLHAPRMAVIYAMLAAVCSLGMGNLVQAHTAADAVSALVPVPPYIVGGALAAVVGVAALGGIRRIARATALIVPALVGLFALFSVVALVINADRIPKALEAIVHGAFTPGSALGGAAGWGIARAMRYGVARGVFSNEAGLGTSVLAHADADVAQPVEQGMWAMFEIFVDTVLMCTLTALVILTSGVMEGGVQGLSGAPLVMEAFSRSFGDMGGALIGVTTLLLALSTLLSWSYCGESAFGYLLDVRALRPAARLRAVRIYRMMFVGIIVLGSAQQIDVVWSAAEIFNALLALPNLIAVMVLSGVVARETRAYFGVIIPRGPASHTP